MFGDFVARWRACQLKSMTSINIQCLISTSLQLHNCVLSQQLVELLSGSCSTAKQESPVGLLEILLGMFQLLFTQEQNCREDRTRPIRDIDLLWTQWFNRNYFYNPFKTPCLYLKALIALMCLFIQKHKMNVPVKSMESLLLLVSSPAHTGEIWCLRNKRTLITY